jgi:large-conductance mechanosensitive channel
MLVGFIIGTAFNEVMPVLVKQVALPPISLLTNRINIADRRFYPSQPGALEVEWDRYRLRSLDRSNVGLCDHWIHHFTCREVYE